MRKGIVWALCFGLLGCHGTVPVEIPINSFSMMAPELSPKGEIEISLSMLPARPALILLDDISKGMGSSGPRFGSAGMGSWQLLGVDMLGDMLGTAQLDLAAGAGNGLQLGFGTSGLTVAYQFFGAPYGQAEAGSWSAAMSYRYSSYRVEDSESVFLSSTHYEYSSNVELHSLEFSQGYRSSAKSLIYWGVI